MIERAVGSTSSANNVHEVGNDNSNPYMNMVMDAIRMNEGNVNQYPIVKEELNADATRFFNMLKDSDGPLWDDHWGFTEIFAAHAIINDGLAVGDLPLETQTK